MKKIILLIVLVSSIMAEKNYIIGTASTGGTYYPMGIAFANLPSNIKFSAISSAGSGENIKMLENKEIDFALLHGVFGYMAWNGVLNYEDKPKTNLRSVSSLWYNIEHFVITTDNYKTGNISDLKNLYSKGFSITERNSGSKTSGELILKALDINYNKMKLEYIGFNPSADAMLNRRIQGMNTPGGVPVPAVSTVFSTMADKVKILSFSDEDLKKINAKYNLWVPMVIKSGTYNGQSEDIKTIAQPNILVANSDTPEEVVYQLTKSIYENLPKLQAVHKAALDMSTDNALKGLIIPLHKGAIKYYKEIGINIPDKLIE